MLVCVDIKTPEKSRFKVKSLLNMEVKTVFAITPHYICSIVGCSTNWIDNIYHGLNFEGQISEWIFFFKKCWTLVWIGGIYTSPKHQHTSPKPPFIWQKTPRGHGRSHPDFLCSPQVPRERAMQGVCPPGVGTDSHAILASRWWRHKKE